MAPGGAGAFKLPLDAMILVVPIGYACAAFLGLCAHTATRDPEMTRSPDYYADLEKAGRAGEAYNSDFKKYFDARINRGSLGVFDNEYKLK